MEIVQVISGGIALACLIFDTFTALVYYIGVRGATLNYDEDGKALVGGCSLLIAVPTTMIMIISGAIWILTLIAAQAP